ncbi:MAG: hypothetical protein FWF54_04850 [Candidatus Azobacteroides sp.]|nr:hypothetical protein [Candidatus Azobacteroides sp.]
MKKIGLFLLSTTGLFMLQKAQIHAQGVDFSIGGDIVSSYVWRGSLLSNASVQPAMGAYYKGFSLSAWGSVDVTGGDYGDYKEVDFTAAYETGGLSLAVTDYWCSAERTYNYFHYGAHDTQHFFEGTAGYTLPWDKFPLTLVWNMVFAGADYYSEGGGRSYSTYIEASYPFSIKTVDLELSMGLTPWEGMYAGDFAVVSIGLKAAGKIKITDSFSLPVFGRLLANPKTEDMFFVFGVKL